MRRMMFGVVVVLTAAAIPVAVRLAPESDAGLGDVQATSTAAEVPAEAAAAVQPLALAAPAAMVEATGPTSFLETFAGVPAAATPWDPTNWDVSIYSRDVGTWDTLEAMDAQHGAACEAPPTTHRVSSYEDAVFQCNDHMMTAISAGGYGQIVLTPAAMVDFSAGEAVVRWDMSTLRTSGRDWVDLWITPFEDHNQIPDVQGKPRRGIWVYMDLTGNWFQTRVYDNGQEVAHLVHGTEYENFLVPDAKRRDTFELRLSQNHLSFGMPAYGQTWSDGQIDLDWSVGVVQFGHHSYNPTKDDHFANPQPNTWHWDNVEISPARTFTMIDADRRFAGPGATTVNFVTPAPSDAFIRFAAIGGNLEMSVDGGPWQAPNRQYSSDKLGEGESFDSYLTPVPAGARSVSFRAEGTYAGQWRVQDLSLFASSGFTAPGAGSVPSTGRVDPNAVGRILDTRPSQATVDGQSAGIGARAAGSVTELQVAGRAGVAADAEAVVLNLTAAEASGTGFVTVWACGQPMPVASSLNFVRDTPVANAVITGLGTGGKVCMLTADSSTQLIADVNGVFPAGSPYAPAVPARILDTRPGLSTSDGQSAGIGARAAGSVTELQVAGRAGVPANAGAVVLNLTATGASGTGFVTMWPCGQPMPVASSLNFVRDTPVANAVIIGLGTGGKVCMLTADSSTHLIADVNGVFPAGSAYAPVVPARILDTRPGLSTFDGQAAGTGLRGAGSVYELQVAGRAGVPANAAAVVLNLTATGASGTGFVTVWACGQTRPNNSNLNFVSNKPVANAVITELGAGGKVCLYTADASVHLIADVNGIVATGPLFQAL